jgi:hypothetical protein
MPRRGGMRAASPRRAPGPYPTPQDNVRDAQGLRAYNLRDFAELVFKTCPELRKHVVRGGCRDPDPGP